MSRWNPPSKDLLTKILLEKLSFLHMLFLENEVQMDQKNNRTMLFMSKQVSLPKLSLILQKMKISPKPGICPLWMKAFNCSVPVNFSWQGVMSFFKEVPQSRSTWQIAAAALHKAKVGVVRDCWANR